MRCARLRIARRVTGVRIVANPQKAKGDRAELEAAKLLTDLLGAPVQRKLGAGRTEDTGDLYGVTNTVVEVKSYKDVTAGIRSAMGGLEAKRVNANVAHAVALIRRPGGEWVAVMTVNQWAKYHVNSLDTNTTPGVP